MLKRFVLCCLLMVAMALNSVESSVAASKKSILILGNSFTYFNKLDDVLENVAKSGGDSVIVERYAEGGMLLVDHCNNRKSQNALKKRRWDLVILQEQSLVPCAEAWRQKYMYPGARTLASRIRGQGSKLMFFSTWGYKNGVNATNEGVHVAMSYSEMQDELNRVYAQIAQELNAPLAPVGQAWKYARSHYPEINLYNKDGKHPSSKGTYLAALTIYAKVFNKSPQKVKYAPSDISSKEASKLRAAAAAVSGGSGGGNGGGGGSGAVQAKFTATPLKGAVPLVVTFQDQSVGNITTRVWDFNGDGEIDYQAATKTFKVRFVARGTYTVTLLVKGPDGQDIEAKMHYIQIQ